MLSIVLQLHRRAGLSIALVLAVAGLTGAALPFERELRRLAALPVWRVTPPRPDAPLLSGPELKVGRGAGASA